VTGRAGRGCWGRQLGDLGRAGRGAGAGGQGRRGGRLEGAPASGVQVAGGGPKTEEGVCRKQCTFAERRRPSVRSQQVEPCASGHCGVLPPCRLHAAPPPTVRLYDFRYLRYVPLRYLRLSALQLPLGRCPPSQRCPPSKRSHSPLLVDPLPPGLDVPGAEFWMPPARWCAGCERVCWMRCMRECRVTAC
jgi:hypothetical protein